MQKWLGTGRLTRDPETRYSQGENATCFSNFTMAVDRRFKRDGEPNADFIQCKAFGKTAEIVEKYFKQGMKIEVVGEIRTGSYTNKDGQKVYTTDIAVENVGFGEGKKDNSDSGTGKPSPSSASGDGFMNIPDGIDEQLPFN